MTPQDNKLPILLLHGFTSGMNCVTGLVPHLVDHNIPYLIPTLRGHAGKPEDLIGVTWRDWLEDARAALLEVTSSRFSSCVIVGLSMGGLLSLNLAAEHKNRVAGIVPVAPCLEFRSPLAKLAGIIRLFFQFWPSRPQYADPNLLSSDQNYTYFPVDSFCSLYAYRKVIYELLPLVEAPIHVIASRADPVVAPTSAFRIIKHCASTDKDIHWFDHSYHEMMRDLEREKVFQSILDFHRRLQQQLGGRDD